jgi:hypothetical protein
LAISKSTREVIALLKQYPDGIYVLNDVRIRSMKAGVEYVPHELRARRFHWVEVREFRIAKVLVPRLCGGECLLAWLARPFARVSALLICLLVVDLDFGLVPVPRVLQPLEVVCDRIEGLGSHVPILEIGWLFLLADLIELQRNDLDLILWKTMLTDSALPGRGMMTQPSVLEVFDGPETCLVTNAIVLSVGVHGPEDERKGSFHAKKEDFHDGGETVGGYGHSAKEALVRDLVAFSEGAGDIHWNSVASIVILETWSYAALHFRCAADIDPRSSPSFFEDQQVHGPDFVVTGGKTLEERDRWRGGALEYVQQARSERQCGSSEDGCKDLESWKDNAMTRVLLVTRGVGDEDPLEDQHEASNGGSGEPFRRQHDDD